MPDFRRGSAAISAAQESNKGSGFKPFCPNIAWTKDREEKYVIFLNPADEIPTVDLHEWIVVGHTKGGKPLYEQFLSRKDPAIGESTDDIEDRLGQKAKSRTIGVAVELEPTFSTVKGRQRPTGFKVKTDTYERKLEGGGTQEVTYPVLGVVVQSPLNFYGWLGSFNEGTANIEETPLHVLRRGKDTNTAYDFTPYIDQPVDFAPLVEHIMGIGYLQDSEGLEDALKGLSEAEAAVHIGSVMLEKRLNELADEERYAELVAPIEELENKWGANTPPASRPTRPSRPSPRPASTNGDTGEAPAPARGSKFAKLREEVEGAAA